MTTRAHGRVSFLQLAIPVCHTLLLLASSLVYPLTLLLDFIPRVRQDPTSPRYDMCGPRGTRPVRCFRRDQHTTTPGPRVWKEGSDG